MKYSTSRLLVAVLLFFPAAGLSLDMASERSFAGISDVPGKLVVFGHTSPDKGGSELSEQLPPESENNGFVTIAGHFKFWGGATGRRERPLLWF